MIDACIYTVDGGKLGYRPIGQLLYIRGPSRRGRMLGVTVGDEVLTGTKYRLLELSETSLLDSLSELCIKGTDEEEAILCTQDKTFLLREVHTSNLHLLVDPTSGQCMEMGKCLLEVRCVPARLEALKKALQAAPYEGPDAPSPSDECIAHLHHQRIFERFQGSEREIRSFLLCNDAILIDGHYRMLSAEYHSRFLRTLTSTLALYEINVKETIDGVRLVKLIAGGEDEQGERRLGDQDKDDRDDVVDDVLESEEKEEFPETIVAHLLNRYINKDGLLDETKISRFYVRQLLRARSVWRLSDLFRAWHSLLGPDFSPALDHLRGLALVTRLPGDEDSQATYFAADELPRQPSAMFTTLFRMRERWPLDELLVYVQEIADELAIPALDLVVRHCRISVDPANPSSRIVTPIIID